MEEITLEELADLLDEACIDASHDLGHVLVHVARPKGGGAGRAFVALNDALGRSWVLWD